MKAIVESHQWRTTPEIHRKIQNTRNPPRKIQLGIKEYKRINGEYSPESKNQLRI